MDLRMLAYFGSRERGVAELTALAMDARLHVAAVHPAGDLSMLAPVDAAAGYLVVLEAGWEPMRSKRGRRPLAGVW